MLGLRTASLVARVASLALVLPSLTVLDVLLASSTPTILADPVLETV